MSEETKGQTILVVDDEEGVVLDLQRRLEELGHHVPATAASAEAAIRIAETSRPHLALMDIHLGGEPDGIAAAETLRRFGVPVIFLTADTDEATLERAKGTQPHGFLAKPLREADLRSTVEIALYKSAVEGELAAAKEELHAFSHSASHDLRAPLRQLRYFSSAALKRNEGEIDEKTRDYLQRIDASALRMENTIDALWEFSKARSAPMRREVVDLSRVARDVAQELAARDPERQVDVSIADGLTVDADSGLLRVLLDNLIGNAWKFSSKVPEARIDLGSERRNGATVYFVRDNGAGFDMRFVDKLFKPFERLHGRSEFDGSGIGLATVRRVVERHSGSVWAESATTGGATFYFTIPSSEPRSR